MYVNSKGEVQSNKPFNICDIFSTFLYTLFERETHPRRPPRSKVHRIRCRDDNS